MKPLPAPVKSDAATVKPDDRGHTADVRATHVPQTDINEHAASYLKRIEHSGLTPEVKEIVKDVVESYGGYNTQTLATSYQSPEEAVQELRRRLEDIKSEEMRLVDPDAALNTLAFLDHHYNPRLYAASRMNARLLDTPMNASTLSYPSGITAEEQSELNRSTISQMSSKNFYGNLHVLSQNVVKYLSEQGLSPYTSIPIAARTICNRVASVVHAYNAESAIVICSTFKPAGSPIPAATWHIDGPFDPLNSDPTKERKAVSTVFGVDTDIYPDEHVHRQKLIEYTRVSEHAWPRRLKLEHQQQNGSLSDAETKELETLTKMLDEIQRTLEETIQPEHITHGKTGDVHLLRCSDPHISSFHRVPEIPSDRLFLQIYPLSARSVAMVAWSNQVAEAEDIALAYLK